MNFPPSFENWLLKNYFRIEMIILIIIIFSLILKNNFLTGTSLTILAILYFIRAQFKMEGEPSILNQLIHKGMPIAWAMAVMGIMFTLLKLPGSSSQIKVGISAITIITILHLILNFRKNENILDEPLIRSLILLAISIITVLYF